MQKPKVGLCFVYLRDRQLQSLGSKGGKQVRVRKRPQPNDGGYDRPWKEVGAWSHTWRVAKGAKAGSERPEQDVAQGAEMTATGREFPFQLTLPSVRVPYYRMGGLVSIPRGMQPGYKDRTD